jgi:hypothetical protein
MGIMVKFKVGDKVVVTRGSRQRSNFNEVGAVGTVINDLSFPIVDFGPTHGKRVINYARLEKYTEPAPNKMVIGKRYRQNSTGNEVICIGHDQGKCVVRYIDGKNRHGQDRYQSRCGKVGQHLSYWTEVGAVKKIKCQAIHFAGGVRNILGAESLSNVEYTFEDGKLINVTMLNN